MARQQRIQLDLNSPAFQRQLFALEMTELRLVFTAFAKLIALDWAMLQTSKGFHWEDAGHTAPAPNGSRIKSIRITQKVRALAYRDRDFMRLLSLHFDHDGAYR